MILAQLLEKHGLRARVESTEATATGSIFQLNTSGVMMVCVSYLDNSSPAHMRYTIRDYVAVCHTPRLCLDAG